MLDQMTLEATRAAGENRLHDFTARMGSRYAQGRNFDCGPGAHRDVSQLSPYIRRRLVLERDTVAAALAAHGHEGAEKFIQEVISRGYFKGWLERRPQVWDSYRDRLIGDLATLDTDRRLRRDVENAEAGQTGIASFDTWAQELVETGYLHNHARMWFASIWIFTLELPWRVGADFFYRHLLDGDPASNTLGWRWVAGLHTRGKPYKAQAWNITKFTHQRFTPRSEDLTEDVRGLEGQEPAGLPDVMPLRAPHVPASDIPTALLITEEDCRPEDFDLDGYDIRATATLSASHLRSPREVSGDVAEFEAGALADAARRMRTEATILRAGVPGDLATWAARAGAAQIVTPYVPTGPLRDWLTEAETALDARGIALCEMRRDWDAAIWPHATAGFFKVKKKIPQILHQTGLS
ncbi:MAG: FAD-binding domain-containing protein [Roseovarius sp.]